MCHDHCHKTNNMLGLNTFLLEELLVQRKQCGFPWGQQGAAWLIHLPSPAGAEVPPGKGCLVMPWGDKQVLIFPSPALASSLSPPQFHCQLPRAVQVHQGPCLISDTPVSTPPAIHSKETQGSPSIVGNLFFPVLILTKIKY